MLKSLIGSDAFVRVLDKELGDKVYAITRNFIEGWVPEVPGIIFNFVCNFSVSFSSKGQITRNKLVEKHAG